MTVPAEWPVQPVSLLYVGVVSIHEAAVIPIEDSLRGQAGCCYYSVQPGFAIEARDLKKYLQQNLALFKIPREFRQIEKLPKTSTGKIAKKELRALYKNDTKK